MGLSYGWSYALAAFTMTLTCCLPLALLATMHYEGTGAQRASALLLGLSLIAGLLALCSALLYYAKLRHSSKWQRHALLGLWILSALGLAGWWTL